MDIIEKLPNGIHTVIGEKGTYLSGGEQQRISVIFRSFPTGIEESRAINDAILILTDTTHPYPGIAMFKIFVPVYTKSIRYGGERSSKSWMHYGSDRNRWSDSIVEVAVIIQTAQRLIRNLIVIRRHGWGIFLIDSYVNVVSNKKDRHHKNPKKRYMLTIHRRIAYLMK